MKHWLGVRGLVVCLWVFGGAGGCSCEGRTDNGRTSVAFVTPLDAEEITSSDDVSPGTVGIQILVTADITGVGDGTAVVLTNSVDTDPSGAPVPTTASVSGDRVVFSAYTLPTVAPGGQVVLRVALEGVSPSETCTGERCAEVRVSVFENACQFVTPRDQDSITADAYPDATDPFDPVETDVIVDCTGVSAGDNVALQVDGGVPQVSQADATGRVSFTQVAVGEGPNVLTVSPRTDAQGQNPQGNPVSATVQVDTGSCIVRLVPGDGARLLAVDDTDTAASGLQAALAVITDCDASANVRLFRKGPGDADFGVFYDSSTDGVFTTVPDPLGLRLQLPSVDVPSSQVAFDVELIARVSQGGTRDGNSLVTRYWVDPDPPVVTRADPTAGACITAASDQDSTTAGIQIIPNGNVFGADTGSEAWLRIETASAPTPTCTDDLGCVAPYRCRQGLCRAVAAVDPATGAFTMNFANATPVPEPLVQLPESNSTLEYIAVDAAGNLSPPFVAAISAFTNQPSVSLVSPTAGTTFTAAQDVDSNTPGLQVQVDVQSNDVPTGTSGQIVVSGQVPQAFNPGEGNATSTVLVTLEDGPRTLTARLVDPCGNDVSSTSVNVNVDATPLALVVTAYDPAGVANRDALPDGSTTALAQVQLDVFTDTSDQDRTLRVTVYDDEGVGTGGERICTGNETVAEESQTVAAAAAGFAFTKNLAEGKNCVAVVLQEGSETLTTTLVLTRSSSTSAGVNITTPSTAAVTWDATADDSDGDPSNGFNQTLAATLSPGPSLDGQLEFDIGGFYTLTQSVSAGSLQVVLLGNVSLPEGAYAITARFVDVLGNISPTTDTVSVSFTNSDLQVALNSPANGAIVQNLSVTVVSEPGSVTPTDCRLVLNGTPEGSDVAWVEPLTLSATVADGDYSVRAECDDNAGGVGITQTLQVTVDTTAPAAPTFVDEDMTAPGQLVFVSGNYINADVPDTSQEAGLQHPVFLQVESGGDDVSAWQLVVSAEVPLSGGGTATPSYTRPLTAGSGTLATASVLSLDFGTADEGPVVLRAQVTDAAGNTSPETVVNLTKDRVPPTLTQTEPSLTQPPFESQSDPGFSVVDDLQATTTEIDLRFSYTTTGASLNADCSANPQDCLLLNLIPAPAVDFSPLRVPVVAGTTTFPLVAFPDNTYSAVAQVQDAAGNAVSAVYPFEVQRVVPVVRRTLPSRPGSPPPADSTPVLLTGSAAGSWGFSAAGFQTPVTIDLCSTVTPPGLSGAPSCRYGSDGILGGANPGVVVATATLNGSVDDSSAFFSGVVLAEGQQVIYAEAKEPDNEPDRVSTPETWLVDTVPPTVSVLTLDQNATGNDGADFIRLGGGGTEGTVVGSTLQTSLTVTLTDGGVGQDLVVFSDRPTANTEVGRTTLATATSATVVLTLPEDDHTLTVQVQDDNGLFNSTSPAVDVMVDVTPGTAPVPASPAAVLRLSNGTLDDKGTTATSDDTLRFDVIVAVDDNQALNGGSVTLGRYDAASGGAVIAGTEASQNLSDTGTSASVTFANFELSRGLNYLETRFTDTAGNVSAAPANAALYSVDLYGPTLVLKITDGSGTEFTVCGDSAATPCDADREAPVSSRVALDRDNTDLEQVEAGTDLVFTLSDCSNSDPTIEDCNSNSLTVRLESRIAGSGTGFAPVADGAFGTLTAGQGAVNDTTNCTLARTGVGCSVFAYAAGFAFDPGITREVRLSTADLNGNVSVSNSVFLQLDYDGVVIEVERLDCVNAPIVPSDALADQRYLGIAENCAAPPTFSTNLRVNLSKVGPGADPDTVSLSINGGSPVVCTSGSPCFSGGAGGPFTADFSAVALTSSTQPSDYVNNTVSVDVTCGGIGCSSRDYSNIVADVEAPTYQFDRDSLCQLGVPLVDRATWCADISGANNGQADANIDGAQQATWNIAGDPTATPVAIAGDQDLPSGSTFSVRSAPALVVQLKGADGDQNVRLDSTAGGLSGNEVDPIETCTGCPAGFNAQAVFTALEVANADNHELSVSFTDRAGNAAVVETGRTAEVIRAKVDTVAPDPVAVTACIGASTAPTGGGLARNTEDAACAAACTNSGSCDRIRGNATLLFNAPGDDGATGATVASYQVRVAALEIPYTGPVTYTSCAQLLTDGPDAVSDEGASFTAVTPATPGAAQTATVGNLYPHRVYCFGVVGVDDAGNRADLSLTAPCGGSPCHGERAVPLLTTVPGTSPGVDGPEQDELTPAAPEDAAAETAFEAALTTYGARLASLGDMDGDGRDDFAVGHGRWPIKLYMSGDGAPIQPTYTIDAATQDAGSLLAQTPIAAGDVNGDGNNDLVICSTSHRRGAGTANGAIFIYHGTGEASPGVPGAGITAVSNAGDGEVPSLVPNQALYGPDNASLCNRIVVANVDGVAGDDLIFATSSSASASFKGVYGISGGRTFSTGQIDLNLTTTALGSDGVETRHDFQFQARSASGAFPGAVEVVDLDGDGTLDVAYSDPAVAVGDQDGEVYVFQGGTALRGVQAVPDTVAPPTEMLRLVRFTGLSGTNDNFGAELFRVPQPLSAQNNDWLLIRVNKGSANRMAVLRPTSAAPVVTLNDDTTDTLDRTDWGGVAFSEPFPYGGCVGMIGEMDGQPGIDFVVGGGVDENSQTAFVYSFVPNQAGDDGTFAKRAILRSARTGFGAACAGLNNYSGGGAPEMVLTTFGLPTIPPPGTIHLYR